jgi:hypothetical protein
MFVKDVVLKRYERRNVERAFAGGITERVIGHAEIAGLMVTILWWLLAP